MVRARFPHQKGFFPVQCSSAEVHAFNVLAGCAQLRFLMCHLVRKGAIKLTSELPVPEGMG